MFIVNYPFIINTLIPVTMASGCISFILCWYQLGFGEKVRVKDDAIEMGAMEQENDITEAPVDGDEKPTKDEE